MESRIATLLGDSSFDRPGIDPIPLLPPPSLAPPVRRPHPLEPHTVSKKTSGDLSSDHQHSLNANTKKPSNKRQNPSVPIAGVLNHETPAPAATHPATSSTSPSSLPPFSGRLSDLLLDPSQQHVNKRRRLDDSRHVTNPPVQQLASSDNKLKLPEPTQQPPKKTPKRPRIPPLLQGLHHPPPLPEKAFPPITGEGSGFGRDIGERPGARSPVRLGSIEERENRADVGREDVSNLRIEKSRGDVGKRTAASTSDKENPENIQKDTALAKTSKTKETRKRNKWSDQETKHLLIGVSRFGIGSWKKILQCPDFTFNQRTAVDLKDRFRVCRPGDGLKLRKSTRKENTNDPPSQDTTSSALSSTPTTSQETFSQDPTASIKSKRPRPETDRKGPAELAQMGIHAPFTKHKRRERREFTKDDDANLLVGFEKYNTSWHLMRDDKELGFDGRHATDLRDRFRIRYPDKFAKAGCKPKAKDESMLKEKQSQTVQGDKDGATKESQEARREDSLNTRKSVKEVSKATSSSASKPSVSALVGSTYRPHALREPLRHSFPSPLSEFADMPSDGDADGTSSPIVLSRNIFQWVDANPSQVSTSSTSSMLAMSSLNTDSSLHILNGADGFHIDPSVTYNNAPMTLLTSNFLSAISSSSPMSAQHQTSGSHTSSIQVHASPSTTAPSANTALATLPHTTSRATNPLLRTPNLPTMMYPPVPVSSARSAVHNLPPPADLLSGLGFDADARPEAGQAASGFVLDENFVFALPSATAAAAGFDHSATLAPMVGGSGQGIFHLHRELLDERVGGRS